MKLPPGRLLYLSSLPLAFFTLPSPRGNWAGLVIEKQDVYIYKATLEKSLVRVTGRNQYNFIYNVIFKMKSQMNYNRTVFN